MSAPSSSRQSTQASTTRPADELDDGPPGVVEHAEDQLADAAGVLAEQARRAAGLELVDPVQREPHRVLEDPAADRDLHPLARPRRPPAAPEADRRADDRDRQHRAPPGASRAAVRQAATAPAAQRRQPAAAALPSRTLSITSFVAAGGTNRRSVATERVASAATSVSRWPLSSPVQLAIEPAERAMSRPLLARFRRGGLPPQRAPLLAEPLEPQAGWPAVDSRTLRAILP